MYGKGVFYEDAVNEVMPAAYEAAIKEAELDVVGQPEIDVDNIGDDGVLFKATVYVKPEVKIEGYLGLEAEKEAVKVPAELIRERADFNIPIYVVSVEVTFRDGEEEFIRLMKESLKEKLHK